MLRSIATLHEVDMFSPSSMPISAAMKLRCPCRAIQRFAPSYFPSSFGSPLPLTYRSQHQLICCGESRSYRYVVAGALRQNDSGSVDYSRISISVTWQQEFSFLSASGFSIPTLRARQATEGAVFSRS